MAGGAEIGMPFVAVLRAGAPPNVALLKPKPEAGLPDPAEEPDGEAWGVVEAPKADPKIVLPGPEAGDADDSCAPGALNPDPKTMPLGDAAGPDVAAAAESLAVLKAEPKPVLKEVGEDVGPGEGAPSSGLLGTAAGEGEAEGLPGRNPGPKTVSFGAAAGVDAGARLGPDAGGELSLAKMPPAFVGGVPEIG